MTRIAIVIGSTRPGRKAAEVAAWVHDIAARREDAAFEVVDLAEHDLPLLDEPMPPSLGDYEHRHTQDWAQVVDSYDGFVFVTPEYNHGPSAALKNALDFVYAEWNNKAAGFVGYGATGGIRAVEQLRLVVAELQMATVRAQGALSLFDDFVDMARFQPRPHHEQQISAMLDQLVAWSEALGRSRAA